MSAQAAPKLQFTLRSRSGVQAFWATDAAKIEGLNAGESARVFQYSKDGSLLAIVNPGNVAIYETQNGTLFHSIPRANVIAVDFSPENGFITTFERLEKTIQNHENLILWKIETEKEVASWTQKIFQAEKWPSVIWSPDETYYARIVSTEIHLFVAKSANPSLVVKRIQIADVQRAMFAPVTKAASYLLAVLVPERKSQPGSVRIYSVPPPSSNDNARSLASKSFFKGTEGNILWNNDGTAVIASLSTDVDQTGKSYYGETALYYITADQSYEGTVKLQKEGPIHDVRWSPSGKEFAVCYGFMPAQTTLFDSKCNPIVDFGAAARNTIRFSPNGKLMCLGGFGNLQGQMDFWNIKTTTKVGAAQAHCAAVCEWAPDSRHFIAAVISPRIRVDNGYKIFDYHGSLIKEAPVNELYQVEWRPSKAGAFPDRPLSPGPAAGVANNVNNNAAVNNNNAQTKTASPAAAPAKYRHPNASQGTFTMAREDTGVKKYTPPSVAARAEPKNSAPPGWFEDDNKEKKPKRKRSKKKKAGAAGAEGDDDDDEEENVNSPALGQPPLVPSDSPAASPKPRNKNTNTNSPSVERITQATESLNIKQGKGPKKT